MNWSVDRNRTSAWCWSVDRNRTSAWCWSVDRNRTSAWCWSLGRNKTHAVCLQAEKRKLLMEQETQKIKELEEQYANELRAWKAMLVPRKQVSTCMSDYGPGKPYWCLGNRSVPA